MREERRGSRNDPIIMKGKGPRDLLRNSLEWLAYLQFGVSTIDGLHPSVRHSFASGGKMNPPGTAGDYSSIKIELPDERAGSDAAAVVMCVRALPSCVPSESPFFLDAILILCRLP